MKTIPLATWAPRGFFAIIVALGLAYSGTDPWIDPSFSYRIAITNLNPINPSAAGRLTDFPVLIAVTNASWLRPALASGGDITFAGVDGKQLFHEIEYFGRGAGLSTLQAWVCLPTFSNNTTIYMYWGNTSANLPFNGSNTVATVASSFATMITPDISTNVWDTNYLCVLHLNDATTVNYILAKDSTRYQTTTTTPSGSNVVTNQAGIGVGTLGNSMNARLGLMSTNIKIGSGGYGADRVRGVYVDKFNNNVGNPAYDLLNGSASGNFTMSMWSKWLSYPSNQGSWNGFGYATNMTSLPVMAIKDGGQNIRDSRTHYYQFARTTNSQGRNRLKGIGSDTITQTTVTNITNFGHWNAYSNWYRYVATAGTIGANFYLTNWVNDAMVYNASGAPTTGTTYPGGLYFTGNDGGDWTYDQLFTPYMLFDEIRFSYGVRSANWLSNEYSNVVNATNMTFDNGLESASVEALFRADITNYNTFPSPTFGGTVRLGLVTTTLVVPNRPPNYLTNVNYVLFDLTGLSNLVDTNLYFTEETNDFSFTFGPLPSGPVRLTGSIYDFNSNVAALQAYTFPVGPVGFYDLQNLSIYNSNAGFIVDLFSGLDGGNAVPTSNFIFRDGVNMGTNVQSLGGGRYYDTSDLFYDESRLYKVSIQYSNLVYYTNVTTVTPVRRTETASIGAAGGIVENFELKVTVPANALPTTRSMSVSFPPDVVGIDAYRQMILDDGNGLFETFSQPVTLRLKVRVSGGSVTVPGTTKRVVLNDAAKLRLGYWDGFQWNPLPTTLVAYSNRLELNTQVTREGRFALLFNDGFSSPLEPFRVRNRVMQPGSSDPVYGTIYFGWDKTLAEKVTLTVMNSAGRVIYQKRDMVDPFWIWDGKGNDGVLVSAGVYIYQVSLGSGKTYRGTLAIMAK